jgi:hypothetical protein
MEENPQDNKAQTDNSRILEKLKARKKLILGVIATVVSAPIGRVRMQDGVTTLVESNLGGLILLIILGTGVVKVAKKNPEGWLWASAFFLYSGFSHFGVTTWVYLIIAGLGVWTYIRWTNSKK